MRKHHRAKMSKSYKLTTDPLYYVTVAFFALITTALPAALGQPRFMPVAQALSLTIFMVIVLRRGDAARAYQLVLMWLVIQITVIGALSVFFPAQLERALPAGFLYRTALTSWLYTDAPLPGGLLAAPASRFLEIAGVIFGSLISAGIVGTWFLVRMANLTGYSIGSLLNAIEDGFSILAVLPLWSIAYLISLAAWLVLCAEPLLTRNWSPQFYWRNRRLLVLIAVAFLALAILLELSIAPLWKGLAQ
jgi:hypothetical protein